MERYIEVSKAPRALLPALVGGIFLGLAACEPEVGSEAWCARMDETPKGDWTVNQAADYARHCLFD